MSQLIESRLEKLRERQQKELHKLVLKHTTQTSDLIDKLSAKIARQQYKKEHKK